MRVLVSPRWALAPKAWAFCHFRTDLALADEERCDTL
jgi:hypothetical protein